ncbi:MAG TPA: hypothetical protein VMR97_07875 [Acidimicrobiales bacterium]|nr:hypothetical protein [Acidimicrobiales bacterium]
MSRSTKRYEDVVVSAVDGRVWLGIADVGGALLDAGEADALRSQLLSATNEALSQGAR